MFTGGLGKARDIMLHVFQCSKDYKIFNQINQNFPSVPKRKVTDIKDTATLWYTSRSVLMVNSVGMYKLNFTSVTLD